MQSVTGEPIKDREVDPNVHRQYWNRLESSKCGVHFGSELPQSHTLPHEDLLILTNVELSVQITQKMNLSSSRQEIHSVSQPSFLQYYLPKHANFGVRLLEHNFR